MNVRSSTPVSPPLAKAMVDEQLSRILDSPQFRNSKRCSDFLRHVVEATVEGRSDSVKERNLGVAIFERDPNYDTNEDPIVRNTAGQVRKRLAQYYIAPGHETELRIDLPPGSYVPEISPPAVAPAVEPAPSAADTEPGRRYSLRRLVPGIAVIAVIAAAAVVLTVRPQTSRLDEFWAPVLRIPGPITLSVGQGHTYKLNESWDRFFEGRAGERPQQPAPAAAIPVDTIVPTWDRYIGISDAQAAMRLAKLFAQFGKEVNLRGGRATSLADLRGKPVVLVGAFNNEWTLRLTGELRFYFDSEGGEFFVRDRLHPENRSWQVETDPENPRIQTDYAIVSRVFDPTTEQAVVMAGGIKGGGTYAAGEFLTNPRYMSEALEDAPSGWKDRNVQFVLSTRMYSGTPGPPQVVAAHYQ